MIGNRGQLFTFDSLLAVLLISLVLVTSGRVAGIARERGTDYVNRYSLERRASDAADILVRSPGVPENWYKSSSDIQTPGLSDVSDNGNPIPNRIDGKRLSKLRNILKSEEWEKNNEKVKAIKGLFGNSNFSIILQDSQGEKLQHMCPNYDEGFSRTSDSFEAATVERRMYGSLTDVRAESPPLIREGGKDIENLEFEIYEGEIESFDWYLYAENLQILDKKYNKNYQIKVSINREANGSPDFTFLKTEVSIPGSERIDEGVSDPIDVGSNFIDMKFTAVPDISYFKFYVVGVPEGVSFDPSKDIKEFPITLKIRVWR